MIEFLRDGIWQFVGAAIALLAIPFSYWLYLLQRRHKELAFGTTSTRALLSVADELSQRVVVSLDGHSVEDIHLFVLAVKNSGNTPITPDDFIRPLTVTFGSGARVISASVSKQFPTNLGAMLEVNETSIVLMPLLLNPLDCVVAQVLLSAKTPIAAADTRIVDVASLVPLANPGRATKTHLEVVSGLAGIFGAIVAILTSLNPKIDDNSITGLFIAVLTAASIYIATALLRSKFGPEARRQVNDA